MTPSRCAGELRPRFVSLRCECSNECVMLFASFAVLPLFLCPLFNRPLFSFQLLALLCALAREERKRRRYRDEGEDDVGVHGCACMQRLCSASRFAHRPPHTLFGREQSIFLYIFHIKMASHAP